MGRYVEMRARLLYAALSGAMPRVSTVAVTRDAHLLMGVRRDNGKWTVPGGHAEKGETPIAAAFRELKEEAGVEAQDLRQLGHTRLVGPGLDGLMREITCFMWDLTGKPCPRFTTAHDPDQEIYGWQWIPIEGGLPQHIVSNLHVPASRNVLLQELGLLEQRQEAPMTAPSLMSKLSKLAGDTDDFTESGRRTVEGQRKKLLSAGLGEKKEPKENGGKPVGTKGDSGGKGDPTPGQGAGKESPIEPGKEGKDGGAAPKNSGEKPEGAERDLEEEPKYDEPTKKSEGELLQPPEAFLDPDGERQETKELTPADRQAEIDQNRAAGGDPQIATDDDKEQIDEHLAKDFSANPIVEAFNKAFKKFLGDEPPAGKKKDDRIGNADVEDSSGAGTGDDAGDADNRDGVPPPVEGDKKRKVA